MNQEYGREDAVQDEADGAEATRRDAGDAESSRANRGWWDRNADEYQSEHGSFLGDDRFVWGPEGLDEAEAGLLGPAASLKGLDVLEIGAGAAQCSRWLAAQGARPVALDLSHRQLQHALRIGDEVPLVESRRGGAAVRDGSFDLACSAYGAVPFVADPVRVFREVRRVLRPGGRWVFSVTHPIRWAFPDEPGPEGSRSRPPTSTARRTSSRTRRGARCTWSTTGRSGTGCGTWWPAGSAWWTWSSRSGLPGTARSGAAGPRCGEPDPGDGDLRVRAGGVEEEKGRRRPYRLRQSYLRTYRWALWTTGLVFSCAYETECVIRNEALDRLPVRHAVPELLSALAERGTAVLSAPPGTGKTTLVPLALAGLIGDGPARRVLVAEPRRMAVRAAARRMAWLLGEEVGGAVGFSVRGERRTGPATRVEVVTTGILLQRLQRDPELAGVDVVLLDECHERHLDADTAMAFLVDVRATLRPDLKLIAASATSDAEAWSQLLTVLDGSGPAPVVRSVGEGTVTRSGSPRRPPGSGRARHLGGSGAAAPRGGDGPARPGAARGDVLCFLPGTGEIARTAGLLADLDAEVLQLHGRAPAAVQDAVLRGAEPGGRRRVVLSTAVAESSVTVPGVRVVVDSGLAREPRTDHARGLGSLATVPVSTAAATQRAGRSGREAFGVVYRCWAEAEDGGRARFPSPEIRIADLADFALRAACWGDPTAGGSRCSTRRRPGRWRRPARSSGRSGPWTRRAGPRSAGYGCPGSGSIPGWAVPCWTGRRRSGSGGPPRWSRCSARSRRATTGTTWWRPGGRPAGVRTGTARGGGRRRAAWNGRPARW